MITLLLILLSLALLGSIALLVIGLISPGSALFWYKGKRTRAVAFLIYLGCMIGCFVLIGICAPHYKPLITEEPPPTDQAITVASKEEPQTEAPPAVPVVDEAAQKSAQEESEVNKKLKARAARDWPDDYSTQEYWVNENIEAYRYMKTIPDNSTKKKAQRDWPLDFSTQKYWYDEQMEAKDRLGK